MTLPTELAPAFRKRPTDANKRSVGTVAVVGGSRRYSHAPVIAGLGARAAGAGLVQLAVPDESRACAAALLPEATFADFASGEPLRTDVVVVGMGLGSGAVAEGAVMRALASPGRFVFDADALGVLAGLAARPGGFAPANGQELVLTPHEGEAARLLGCRPEQIKSDRPAAAKAIAARYGATVVLKGPHTLVVSSDGASFYDNPTGNPSMALGGMGDLLAGVIGARWAYLKGDPFLAAASSAWLHGAASDGLVADGIDPSIVGTASAIGAMRMRLDI